MPVHQLLRRAELLAVDHRVGQHVLHVLTGLVERNVLHPHVERQVVGAAQPLAHAAGAGVVGGGGEHPVAVELAVHLAQVGGTELDVLLRSQGLFGVGQRDAELACGLLGGARHQLHQAHGADRRAGVGHEGAFLAGDGEHPAGVQAAQLGLLGQAALVRHGEADIQVIPVLRLADGADGREVPALVVGQFGLGDHFVAAEQAADVVPLAATVDDLAAIVELQGATDACRVADFLHHLRIDGHRLVVEAVGHLDAVGGEEAVEVALLGQRLVQGDGLLTLGLGQLQTARLPVAPATGGGQRARHATGQLVGLVPATVAQQQARTPFGHGVVAQLRVVLGHDLERADIEALGQGQADFAGDGDLFLGGEGQFAGIDVQQTQGLFRILACQATQAEAGGVGHVAIGRGETCGLAHHLRFLRRIEHQLALLAEVGQALDQVAGQAVVARLGGQLGALPAAILIELAIGAPGAEQRVAGLGLGFADQPQLLGGDPGFGFHALFVQVLAIQAVQFGEVELGVVVVGEGLPLAALGQPAQPAQFHPAGLGQVAVLGEERLDLVVAGPFQAGGEFVVGQVGLQRIVTQGIGVAQVRALVALGQGALGFVIHLPLLGQIGGLSAGEAEGAGKERGKQAEQRAAHDTSGQRKRNGAFA